jgi:putative ABC transport system substrate-binding protein
MDRRDFISLLGGAAIAWPRAAHAQAAHAQQEGRARRVGILMNTGLNNRLDAFKQALASLGWIESRNLRIDYRPVSSDPPAAI